jgi:gliding motility-associated-like protein
VSPYSYNWNGVAGSTSKISGLSPGSYTVVVKDKNGCSNTETVTILADGLDAGYITSPSEPPFSLSQDILFHNTTVNGKSYFWDFGDGTSDMLENPTHSYSSPGKYTVLLISKSTNGCIDSAISILEVGNLLQISNVFTPNGDGRNDVFKIKSFGIKSLHISIYDRWGMKMFESDSLDPEWDGTNKKGEAIDGTYYYVVHAEATDNTSIDRAGFVTLIKSILQK